MKIKILNSTIWAIFIMIAPAWAVQETRPSGLFDGITCEEVETRAGEIMLYRQISARKDDALLFMQKTDLDRALIDDAFKVGHKIDSREMFAAVDDFRSRWMVICKESTK